MRIPQDPSKKCAVLVAIHKETVYMLVTQVRLMVWAHGVFLFSEWLSGTRWLSTKRSVPIRKDYIYTTTTPACLSPRTCPCLPLVSTCHNSCLWYHMISKYIKHIVLVYHPWNDRLWLQVFQGTSWGIQRAIMLWLAPTTEEWCFAMEFDIFWLDLQNLHIAHSHFGLSQS